MKINDYQQRDVYYAQEEAFNSYYGEHFCETMEWDDFTDLFENIKNSDLYRKLGGSQNLTLSYSNDRRRTKCYYFFHREEISIIDFGINSMVLCHEISHHLTRQFAPDLPHHGPTFMGIFLSLIYHFGTRDEEIDFLNTEMPESSMFLCLFENCVQQNIDINLSLMKQLCLDMCDAA